MQQVEYSTLLSIYSPPIRQPSREMLIEIGKSDLILANQSLFRMI